MYYAPWPPGHRIIGLEVQLEQQSPWGENSARGICADSCYQPSPCWPYRDPDAASVRFTGFVERSEAAPPPGAWAWLWYIACVRVACVRECVRACMDEIINLIWVWQAHTGQPCFKLPESDEHQVAVSAGAEDTQSDGQWHWRVMTREQWMFILDSITRPSV